MSNHEDGSLAPVNIARIRHALAKGEFVLYYQPVVNMSTGTVMGAEALIRWRHPQEGLLSPAAFLPMIAHDALAVELGEWVMDTALLQLGEWLDAGFDLQVSVNVDVRQLMEPEFVDRLAKLLAGHPRVPPSKLELEILGTGAVEDVGRLAAMFAGCRALGVSFALDDFGAGNSSLNDLKRSPAGVLKIDPSFVRGILESPEELSILEGVLGLATAFRRKSVAEGVESVDQGLMLLKLGCELAQGYGIAHPMPGRDFPGWVAEWRPDPRWTKTLSASEKERPLTFAGAEHRAWMTAIEALVKGESIVQPRLSRHQCQLGVWIDAESAATGGSKPGFQMIAAMHFRLHALATGTLALHAQSRSEDAHVRYCEANVQLDKLLTHLESFK